jgi:hypothetical protein
MLFCDCRRERTSDCGVAGDFGRRSDGGHRTFQVPIIVHRETIPPVHTASDRNSAIGDMLGDAVSKQLQHFSDSDRCDPECPFYITKATRPAWIGAVTTERLIPSPFGGPARSRLSDGQHACSLVKPHVYALVFLQRRALGESGIWRRKRWR